MDEETTKTYEQVRVIQWGVWRSLSTTFLRCILNGDKTEALCEPFGLPWYFGKEARTSRQLEPIEIPEDSATFEKVKQKYEGQFQDKEVVFGKEFAFYVFPEEHFKYIPKGYRHSFLIRHPYKTCVSMQRVFRAQTDPGYWNFLDEEVGFEEVYLLWKHVKENLDPEAIIIDADDFVRHPEETLKAYCENYGIKYTENMLSWDPDLLTEEMSVYGESWFGDLLSSTTVRKDENAVNLLENPPDLSELEESVRASIEKSLPFYRKLHEHRLKID